MVVGIAPEVSVFSELISSFFDSFLVKSIKKLTLEKAAMAKGITGSGLVCACNIKEGVGKVKNLLPKYENSMFVIFLGCSEDEIDGSVDHLNNKERKQVKGMLRSWRKLNINRVKDMSLASVRNMISSQVDDPEKNKRGSGIQNLFTELRDFSSSLPRNDNRPGALIFFPCIPGFGKSTITDLRGDDLEKINLSNKGRKVKVLSSDSLKQKFWPQVRQEKVGDTSSIFIADKNAPPNAWDTVSSICDGARNKAISILPSGAALRTTEVEGGIELLTPNTSKKISYVKHYYPFSLQYLAVCITRVLNRSRGTHAGGLDKSTADACMIVIKFYCLYRNISSENLVHRLSNLGGDQSNSVICSVPFFKDDIDMTLPQDLHDSISDGIRLQASVLIHDSFM